LRRLRKGKNNEWKWKIAIIKNVLHKNEVGILTKTVYSGLENEVKYFILLFNMVK